MRRVHENGAGFIVRGEISFNTVLLLHEEGLLLLKQLPAREVNIDLSLVTKVDNVALALLTAWYRNANTMQKTIHYTNVPKALEQMASILGVDFLLTEHPSEVPINTHDIALDHRLG